MDTAIAGGSQTKRLVRQRLGLFTAGNGRILIGVNLDVVGTGVRVHIIMSVDAEAAMAPITAIFIVGIVSKKDCCTQSACQKTQQESAHTHLAAWLRPWLRKTVST